MTTSYSPFRPCVLVPTYNNPKTVRKVVSEARRFIKDVVLVDDGSAPEGQAACDAIEAEGLAYVKRRPKNGGKGAAVKTGFEVATQLGFTHAVQVDADGQHDLSRMPAFLAAGQDNPQALILGYPEYDDSVPTVRRIARRFTDFWVALETGRGIIRDAMVGFRCYPLALARQVNAGGNRMDFDVEIAVRMAWAKVPIINVPVGVRYLSADEGGISHFQPFWDNVRFSWLHTRLTTLGVFVRLYRWFKP